jgi:hypothetical protein
VSPIQPQKQRDDGAARQHQTQRCVGRQTFELYNDGRHGVLTKHHRQLQNHPGGDRGRDCKSRLSKPYG